MGLCGNFSSRAYKPLSLVALVRLTLHCNPAKAKIIELQIPRVPAINNEHSPTQMYMKALNPKIIVFSTEAMSFTPQEPKARRGLIYRNMEIYSPLHMT